MPQPRLTIRSARAKALAYRLAKKEQRTVSQIVERALEAYAKPKGAREKETAAGFWERVRRENRLDEGPDFDLDAIIREDRKPHTGIDL